MMFFKKKPQKPAEDYIMFSVPQIEGPSKITVSFSKDTKPERFGAVAAMINKGMLGPHLLTSISDYAKTHDLVDLSNTIKNEIKENSDQIDGIVDEFRYEEESISENYPIAPAWGDPELTDLYDNTFNEDPRKIAWQYLENREEETLGDEIDEEDSDEGEGKPKGLYAIDGVNGLLSESQFRRLQNSDKPNYSVPPYEMRIAFTNFNLGINSMIAIANSNGVEYIKIIGRYSFIIAIGKMFDFGDVRREIEKKLEIEYGKEIQPE